MALALAETDDEKEVVRSAAMGDIGTLAGLLQKGVCVNVQVGDMR